MSDGISEGYRAARQEDRYQKLWQDAQVEGILLDLATKFKEWSNGQLIERLMEITDGVDLRREQGWLVKHSWGEHFTQSLYNEDKHLWPQVSKYSIRVGSDKFYSYDMHDALIQAVLFAEWSKTPEGKEALRIRDDY